MRKNPPLSAGSASILPNFTPSWDGSFCFYYGFFFLFSDLLLGRFSYFPEFERVYTLAFRTLPASFEEVGLTAMEQDHCQVTTKTHSGLAINQIGADIFVSH